VGVVTITMLLGTLISVELSESAEFH